MAKEKPKQEPKNEPKVEPKPKRSSFGHPTRLRKAHG